MIGLMMMVIKTWAIGLKKLQKPQGNDTIVMEGIEGTEYLTD